MRATGFYAKNVLGIHELRIKPGQITKISGANGSGKSSAIQALQAVVGGGNLMHLKRVDSDEEPEVGLVLDDGRTLVEKKGDDTVVKQRVGDTAAYEEIRRPQTWLNGLFDPFGTNPMTFLNAKPMERADLLLKALPLELDRGALMAAIGNAWPEGRALVDGHPLHVLAAARDVLFDERTGVNRTQKEKEKAAYQLNSNLPAKMPNDPAGELQKAAQARDGLFKKQSDLRAAAEVAEKRAVEAAQAVYDEADTRVTGAFKAAAAKLRTAEAERVGAVKEELERAIAALRTKAGEDIQAIHAATTKDIEVEKGKGEAELATATETLDRAQELASAARQAAFADVDAMQAELQAAEQKLADLTALSRDFAQKLEQKRMADEFDRDSKDLAEVSQRLTRALGEVDVFKAQLLNGLPIDGLEVRGKDIFVGGVPFEQLNTAAKMELAIQVAVLRAKATTLKLVCVDGAEALDSEHLKLMEERLLASGVTAWIALVDDGPFKVETIDGPPQKVVAMPPPATPKAAGRRRSPALQE